MPKNWSCGRLQCLFRAVLRVSDMGLGYDIFKKLDDGSPIWVGQADSLGAAQQALESLRRASPGHYFLRDANSGAVIPDSDPRKT